MIDDVRLAVLGRAPVHFIGKMSFDHYGFGIAPTSTSRSLRPHPRDTLESVRRSDARPPASPSSHPIGPSTVARLVDDCPRSSWPGARPAPAVEPIACALRWSAYRRAQPTGRTIVVFDRYTAFAALDVEVAGAARPGALLATGVKGPAPTRRSSAQRRRQGRTRASRRCSTPQPGRARHRDPVEQRGVRRDRRPHDHDHVLGQLLKNASTAGTHTHGYPILISDLIARLEGAAYGPGRRQPAERVADPTDAEAGLRGAAGRPGFSRGDPHDVPHGLVHRDRRGARAA